jgi:hypothetical protein
MTLDEIVTFCRKNNILVWRGEAERAGVVELHFGPPVPAEDSVKDVDKPLGKEKRRGKDGRTAEEQRALYGRVYDAEE